MSIKYYHLAKDETPPDEFCVVRDVGGEPSEYVFYVPESDVVKLREFVQYVANDVYGSHLFDCSGCRFFDGCYNDEKKEHDGRGCQWLLWARELGIEVDA